MTQFVMNLRYTFTPAIVRDLMEIEAARQAVQLTVLPPSIAAALRQGARIRATHYSTRIEGNRLTLAEAQEAVLDGRRFPGRERDVREVQNYYRALGQVEEWAARQTPMTEELICRLHALIFTGARARPSPYRDGQNVIRDGATGAIIYLPPEAADVPRLMASLVAWIATAGREKLPAPVIAGLTHYQFVTVHPFYDGNGRTARALATLILYRHGYDLGHFYSLEEVYAADLAAYYAALQTHPHHNYYEGRADAELTGWLAYFVHGMAATFRHIAAEVQARADRPSAPELPELRQFDRRARVVLGLFTRQESLTTAEIARALALSPRAARDLLANWVAAGWLEVADLARKSRRYRLSAEYRRFIGAITAEE
ncbi:MAG: Fic family protein [Chloroflexi bacterium HGW-Chloroflexi-1]|nr:MAG: Fic family protein [Chloroflexi bacterium HGW-Chloroflexi-1]